MWYIDLPITGCCPECGEDMSGSVRLQASSEWVARYHQDERLARGINRAIERRVIDQHARRCAPKRKRQRAAYAVSA